MYKSYCIFLIFITSLLTAQNKAVEKEIDSFQVNFQKNNQKAFNHISEAYLLSLKIENDSLLSRSTYNLGYFYYYVNKDIEKAKEYFYKSLKYSHKSKNYKILAFSYNQLGLIYEDENRIEDALSFYLKALKVAEEKGLVSMVSSANMNIGNLYLLKKDTLISIKYYEENVQFAKKNNLNKELIANYLNLSKIVENDIIKSLEYLEEAIELAKNIDDKYQIFIIEINQSSLLIKAEDVSLRKKALNHLHNAKNLCKILNDKSLMFYVHFNLAGYYLSIEQIDKAIFEYKNAQKLYQISMGVDQKLNLYTSIYKAYSKNQDYKNALIYKEKEAELSDSIFNLEKNKTFQEIKTKYEVEKKDLKISLLNKENELKTKHKNLVIIGSLLVLVPLVLILLYYKKRIKIQKILKENQEKIFSQEKEKLEQMNEIQRISGIIKGQEKERNRLAKEIHDGLGGSISDLKMGLSLLNKEIKNAVIEKHIQKTDVIYNELREISHNLSSNWIKNKVLEQLILELKTDIEEKHTIEVEISLFPSEKINILNNELKYNVYRIIQELTSNTIKHAEANYISINITNEEDELSLIYEDNGIGIKLKAERGIGFYNLEERINHLNGNFFIDSTCKKGFIMIINIPLTTK